MNDIKYYQNQAEANMDVFLEYQAYEVKKIVLGKIVKAFEERNINWGLACSANLFFRGIVDIFDDFDILIAEEDAEKVMEIMSVLGAFKREIGDQSCFNSVSFQSYYLDGIGVEFIATWRIVTFGTVYCYECSKDELEWVTVNELKIPMIPIEAMYLLYGMMEGWQPQRLYKRMVCETYVKKVGLKYP